MGTFYINPFFISIHHEEQKENIVSNHYKKSSIQTIVTLLEILHVLIITMTEDLRQQLKVLINTYVEQRFDIEKCMDKIIELFQNTNQTQV